MKIFKKVRYQNGRRHIYLFGIKIFSYKRHMPKYKRIYLKRYSGLSRDEIQYCLKQQFKKYIGHRLHLNNPRTFNEKLQWLKLNCQNPLMTKCADKVGVRDYVKEKIGDKYLIPCLGVWDKAEDIDFDALPDRFVLKVNWGSGQNIIVKNKAELDIIETCSQLNTWLKTEHNHYYNFFEWPYKDIKPKIIAEKYLDFAADLLDYKIMCYNGIPKNLFVCSERQSGLKVTFFDLNWKRLPFTRKYPASKKKIERPKELAEMINIAKVLSEPFPFVRVDFFCHNNHLYVGELTFFPGAGLERFTPNKYDKIMGALLLLPHKSCGPAQI